MRRVTCPSLICFTSEHRRQRFLSIIGWTQTNSRIRLVDGWDANAWRHQGRVFYELLAEQPGGQEALWLLLQKLRASRKVSRVIAFKRDLGETETRRIAGILAVSSVEGLRKALGLRFDPIVCAQFQQEFFEEAIPVPPRRVTMADREQAYADRFVENLVSGRRAAEPIPAGLFGRMRTIWNGPVVNGPVAFEVDSIELDGTEGQVATFRLSPPRQAVPWEKTLKAAELAQQGDPVCVSCLVNRASVCYDCNHQALCDDCVRRILPNRACVVCRNECATISRPILTASEM
jgi:hypothetical protein